MASTVKLSIKQEQNEQLQSMQAETLLLKEALEQSVDQLHSSSLQSQQADLHLSELRELHQTLQQANDALQAAVTELTGQVSALTADLESSRQQHTASEGELRHQLSEANAARMTEQADREMERVAGVERENKWAQVLAEQEASLLQVQAVKEEEAKEISRLQVVII